MHRARLEPAPRRLPLPWIGVALLAFWLVAAGVSVVLVSTGETDPAKLPATCLFKRVTDIPCATCGGTRMAAAGLRGDVAGAFALNPFLFLALFALGAWLVLRIGFAKQVAIDAPRPARRVAWMLVGVLFVANWVYLIARGT